MIGENTQRKVIIFFALFACVTVLRSQSLVEVAKKEKERRAALKAKGIKSVVVTNANLNKQKGLPIYDAQSQNISIQGRAQATSSQRRTQARPQTTPQISPQAAPQLKTSEKDQSRDVYGYRKNATKVIFSSGSVKNPEFALSRPDDQYAEISEMGVLELELSAKNGPGADIAIYARMAIRQNVESRENEEEGMPLRAIDTAPQEGFWYGVLGMNDRGQWEEIGKGSGVDSPEEFELGEIEEVKKIRIMFKPHNNPGVVEKPLSLSADKNSIGIDAVEALH
jgi:hypothetical protein